MPMTDPIADMLTRIRNANKAMHETTTMPTSRMKEEIARLLKEEGYITGYRVDEGESFNTLTIELKFGKNRERIITDLKRVSKPGLRVYKGRDHLPRYAQAISFRDSRIEARYVTYPSPGGSSGRAGCARTWSTARSSSSRTRCRRRGSAATLGSFRVSSSSGS